MFLMKPDHLWMDQPLLYGTVCVYRLDSGLFFPPLLPITTTYKTASTAAAQLGLALLHLDATWAARVLRPPTLPLHTHDFTFRWHSLPLICLKYSSSLWINNNSEGGWSHYRGNWPHHSWIATHKHSEVETHTYASAGNRSTPSVCDFCCASFIHEFKRKED